jgi:hypothetical protein
MSAISTCITGVKMSAISRWPTLNRNIFKVYNPTKVYHRYKFSRVGDVNYNLHNPDTINPIPVEDKMEKWKADYAKMIEDMIYEENKPSFEELIENLNDLRTLMQTLEWKFDLKF